MADISKIKIDSTTYNIKDTTARTTANIKLSDAPSDGKQYARKNGAWAEVSGDGSDILYFYQQPVSAATSAEIMRITDSAITADTIVLECTFESQDVIISNVTWTSAAGYISFIGTCTEAATANVTLVKKSN